MAAAGAWPLVGRDDELAWIAAARGQGVGGVVVAGPAGVGKTRLALAFLNSAEEGGDGVFRTSVTSSVATVPFGAFAGVLPVAPAADRLALFQQAAEGLRVRAGDRPLVVGIDDAHLLDAGSAALVHSLVESGAAFVVATVRTGEPAPDPIGKLWQDGLALRLDLQPLSVAEASDLLAEVLGGQVDSATALRLWDQSQGNALFLRELVTSGLDDGSLVDRGGVWAGTGSPSSSPRLIELVDGRIGTLTAEEQTALELLAMAEPLGVNLLVGVTSRAVVNELERRALLTVEQSERRRNLRLAHPLYAERLLGGLGVLRREELSRVLADALAATGARRANDAFRLAGWRLDGGGEIEPEVVLVAARRALTLHDRHLGERLARAAAEAGGGHAALVELGNALYWQGRHDEVLELLATVDQTAMGARDRSQAAILEASTRFFGLGDAAGADAALRAAEASVTDPLWRDDATAHRAALLVYGGQVEGGLRLASAVLDDPGSGDRARARASGPALLAMAITGRPEEADRRAPGALEVAFALVDEVPSIVGSVLVSQCVALWLGGELEALARLSGSLYRASAGNDDDESRGFLGFLVGRSHLASGLVPEATLQFREAAAMLRVHDPGRVLAWCLSGLAQASALAGDDEAAAAALAECDQNRSEAMRAWEPELILARAWRRAAAGERRAACALAVEAADLAASFGERAVEVVALHDAVRLGGLDEVAARLTQLVPQVDGRFAPLVEAHVSALSADDADGLDQVATDFEALGALLLAAEAAAEAAAAHDRAGRQASSLAALERARALADTCGGVRTPALAALDDPAAVATLTPREREVAELAARGLSNPEIADRLFVSVRTVHNHLAHAFAKLGINRRADLAPLFPSAK